MRIAVLFSVAAFGALALQTSVMHLIGVVALVPDLLLVLAVNLGLRHRSLISAVLAFSIGYATDAFSGSRIGLNTLLITIIFLACYETSRHLWVNNDAVGAAAVFLAVAFKDFGTLLLTGGGGDLRIHAGRISAQIFAQALLTACLTPAIFELLRKGGKLLGLPATGERE